MKIITGKTFQGASCAMLMLCLAAFSNASEVAPQTMPDTSSTSVSKSMLIGINAEITDQTGYAKKLPVRVIENGVAVKMTDYPWAKPGSEYVFNVVGWGSHDLKTALFSVVATQKNAPPETSYNLVSYQNINVGSEFIFPLGGGDKHQRYLVLGVTSITPAPTEEKNAK